MADALYNEYKDLRDSTGGKLLTNTIVAYLMATGVGGSQYQFDADHTELTDITAAARVAGPVTVTGFTITDGVVDCDDITFSSVTGAAAQAVVFYDSTDGVPVCYMDGLSLTPNGNNIAISIHASGLFSG